MRLPELCLALLYAAGTGTGAPRAARERPLAPGAARVDPRQAWMLLAGSPGRESGDRGRAGTGAHAAPASAGSPGKPSSGGPASPTMPEELLRELQLLLRGVAKMRRTAGQGCKEEESSKGNPEAGTRHRVEAAFHCQTCEDIAVEQKMWQELGLFYIPEREGLFHRGPGLNLTSGQYTAPIAGYYAFTTTLHIGEPSASPRVLPGRPGMALMPLLCHSAQGAAEEGAGMATEPPAGADLRAVPLPAQQVWQGQGPWEGEGVQHPRERKGLLPPPLPSLFRSHLETVSRLESSSDLFTISVTGTLYLQVGQYASVFVDNTAGSPLTVRSGSDFSAVLLGV
ncbi:adipolin-like isoform X2 [Cinclus cinclus]|uniref:adipolin-like isoform X2 n=1 Tax=Cinclus cinclus TaxID=127875 RepID=UPI002E14B16A